MTDADPRAFALPQPDDVIRIGCADDRLIIHANPPNPAVIDEAKWAAALKSPIVEALVADRTLIAVKAHGKVQVENRSPSPIEIRIARDSKAA